MSPRHLVWAIALWPASASAADWSLSLSGGIATLAGEDGQPFVSLSLYRYIGAGYVRAGAAWFDGQGEPGLAEPLPAQTRQFTIGGGYQTGRVLFDLYATLGNRDFTPPAPARAAGRVVRVETDGSLFTLGGSATWDAPVGEDWTVAPFLALSYSAVDTARTTAPAVGDPVVEEIRQNGVTGIAGVSAERIWRGGSLGAYFAGAATSNRSAVNRQGSGLAASRTPQLIPADDDGDLWAEFGLTGSIQLSASVSLDALVVRTAGFSPGETTSASAGVRVRF
ncbi:autotransporter domain-containing protein [Sphingosinicella sp.]|uniref:autotransporter domain-containing protein n=1 Tax=Sphingosinicella sp. TaxID=1917971 RepID=UPI00403788D0